MPDPTAPCAVTTIRTRTHMDPHRVVGLSAHRVNRRKQRLTDFNVLLQKGGINHTQLAARTGLSLTYISRIVGGMRTPSLFATIALARALKIGLTQMARIILPDEVID